MAFKEAILLILRQYFVDLVLFDKLMFIHNYSGYILDIFAK